MFDMRRLPSKKCGGFGYVRHSILRGEAFRAAEARPPLAVRPGRDESATGGACVEAAAGVRGKGLDARGPQLNRGGGSRPIESRSRNRSAKRSARKTESRGPQRRSNRAYAQMPRNGDFFR